MEDILRAHIDDPRELADLSADDIVAGDPQVRRKVLSHLDDDPHGGMTGIFSALPGALWFRLASAETLSVIEGSASAESDTGERIDLHAGDIVVLPSANWLWTFKTSFRAVFVISPSPH